MNKPQVIKDVSAISPNIDRAIFTETLIIEAINLQGKGKSVTFHGRTKPTQTKI